MQVASAINALPHTLNARSGEWDPLDEPELDSTTYTNGEWTEKSLQLNQPKGKPYLRRT